MWKLRAETNRDLRAWCRAIRVATRPQWQDDDAGEVCARCALAFSFFNRRHHCRSCGKLVCAGCSAQRRTLTYLGYGEEEQRVCDGCVQMVDTRNNEKGRSRRPRAPSAPRSFFSSSLFGRSSPDADADAESPVARKPRAWSADASSDPASTLTSTTADTGQDGSLAAVPEAADAHTEERRNTVMEDARLARQNEIKTRYARERKAMQRRLSSLPG